MLLRPTSAPHMIGPHRRERITCVILEMLLLTSLMGAFRKGNACSPQVTAKMITAGNELCKMHHRTKVPHVPSSRFLRLGENQESLVYTAMLKYS